MGMKKILAITTTVLAVFTVIPFAIAVVEEHHRRKKEGARLTK
jgi:hypothetical protein